MKLIVLKYKYVENAPEDMPLEWPAEVREVGDNDSAPGNDWIIMTNGEYQTYLSTYQEAYDEWFSQQNLDMIIGIPSSCTDKGTKGQFSHDANYLYICIAKDTWKRIAISSW